MLMLSHLIADAQAALARHGDIPVAVWEGGPNNCYMAQSEANTVEKRPSDWTVDPALPVPFFRIGS